MNENRHTPLLSICMPTYNRACLLEQMLRSLVPQVKTFSPEVELIVSDNCSTDNTREVVERARAWGPIRYHRNTRNEGAARNIMLLTNELASGEFAWIIPDDDIVRPDGVDRVLAVLRAHPEVDYVFVNVSCRSSEQRNAFGRPVSSTDFPDLLPTKAKSITDRYVERWEELIDPDVDEVFLGSAMCSVFRLSCWRKYRLELNMTDEILPSLEYTYPHAVVLAHTMRGRKAYYIGYPCVITFWGEQEWLGYVPMILTVRLQELLDLYLQLGVELERVEKCRRALLGHSLEALAKMLVDPTTPGRQYFSFEEFLRRNRFHQAETEDTNYSIKGNPDLPFVFRQETLSSLYLNIGYNYLRKNDKSQFLRFLVRAVATWPLNCQLYASLAKKLATIHKRSCSP